MRRMRIIDLLQQQRPTFSFEFFPPADDDGFDSLYGTIEKLKPLSPSFVSVTYGAGGETRAKTMSLVGRIQNGVGIESMAHLTCARSAKSELESILNNLQGCGIDNVLALRGDPPAGKKGFEPVSDGFSHANELVEFIRSRCGFCIGVAGYPEGHPESPDKRTDLDNLRRKVDAGADFIITQLFFDTADFYRFRDACEWDGVRVPIIAGIMPIQSIKQIKRFTEMCGAKIPADLLDRLESVEDDPDAVRQVGMYHATEQCRDLIDHQVAGIHFYTLNRSTATRAIYQHLKHVTATR